MDLDPIEQYLRGEEPPDGAVILIRGGPVTVEKLVEHARRQEREFSWRGQPMCSVSVDATVAGWTEELILRERLWSRSTFARASIGEVRAARFTILPTHDAPHFDIVLAAATTDEARRLLGAFGEPVSNPFKRRKR